VLRFRDCQRSDRFVGMSGRHQVVLSNESTRQHSASVAMLGRSPVV
jgi:hypothetical protein